jgi:hypothetical protein
MTRRVTVLLLVLSLLMGVPAAAQPAAKKRRPASRTVELKYDGGAVPFVICIDCPGTFSLPGERFVSVEIIDDVAPIGYIDLAWFHPSHDFFPVCGQTKAPQPIPSGAELTAYPWVAPAVDCPTGFSTSGTIKLTFTR